MRTIAVQAECDDGEDDLKGAKRDVEVNHGVYRGCFSFFSRVWNVGV